MSFAIPRKKSHGGPHTQRGTSEGKADNLLLSTNKSFDKTKKSDGWLNTMHLQSQLSNNDEMGSYPQILTNQNSNSNHNGAGGGVTPSSTNYEQVISTKMQRLFDRMGFIEDALSRVELQQDSFRPVLKIIENTHQQQSKSSNNLVALGKQGQTQSRKQLMKENSSSFISQSNGGCLLDKLTKNSQQLNNQSQSSRAMLENGSDASVILNQQTQSFDLTKDEIERIIGSKYDKLKIEFMSYQQQQLQQNEDTFTTQIQTMKQEMIECQSQIQQMITLYQAQLVQNQVQEQLQQVKYNSRPSKVKTPTSIKSPKSSAKKSNPTTSTINNNAGSNGNNNTCDQELFKELTQGFKDQCTDVNNQINCLRAKVDSMDNTYDKRISNLEAVITPLLAQQMNQKFLQETMQQEIQAVIWKNIQSLMSEDKTMLLISQGPSSAAGGISIDKGEQSSSNIILEQEITILKAKDLAYGSNASGTSSSNSSQQQFRHQKVATSSSIQSLTNTNNVINQGSISSTKSDKSNSSGSNSKQQQQFNLNNQNQSASSGSLNPPQSATNQQQLAQQLSAEKQKQINANIVKQQQQQLLKKVSGQNNEVKDYLEDLEQFILTTSETINEKLEDIQRQMGDLNGEIRANVELVKEKRKMNASDTTQFISVLGEDVKQFISCMRDELEQVMAAIAERDDKCKLDMQRIDSKIMNTDSLKMQIQQQLLSNSSNHNSNSSKGSGTFSSDLILNDNELSIQEKKELQKVEAFKEHSLALQRHMDNTSNYLQKEVQAVDLKIDEAKQVILQDLGLNLYLEDDYINGVNQAYEKRQIEKEIREIEEEDQEEEDGLSDQEQQQQQDYEDDDDQIQEDEEDEGGDFGNVGEDGEEELHGQGENYTLVDKIVEMDSDEEGEESYHIQKSIQKQKFGGSTEKKKIRKESQQVINLEPLKTHQSSVSSDKTALLSAKNVISNVNRAQSQNSSNTPNTNSNNYQGGQQQSSNSQPFYYSGVQRNNKTPNPHYNIEVFVSNKSDDEYSGSGSQTYSGSGGMLNHQEIIQYDQNIQDKSRSISTINDEAEPHRTQKSPTSQGGVGGKHFQKYSTHVNK